MAHFQTSRLEAEKIIQEYAKALAVLLVPAPWELRDAQQEQLNAAKGQLARLLDNVYINR